MGRNRGETRGGHPRRLRVRSSLITRYERLIHQFINTRTLTDRTAFHRSTASWVSSPRTACSSPSTAFPSVSLFYNSSRMGNLTDVNGFGHHSARPPRARRHRLLRFLHLPEPPLQARPRRAQGLHLQVPRQGPLNCQSLLFGVSGLIAFSRRRRGRGKKNPNHECLYLHSSGVVAARRWGRTGAAATAFDNKTKTLQTNIYQFTFRATTSFDQAAAVPSLEIHRRFMFLIRLCVNMTTQNC